jgi:hypothetical protein
MVEQRGETPGLKLSQQHFCDANECAEPPRKPNRRCFVPEAHHFCVE